MKSWDSPAKVPPTVSGAIMHDPSPLAKVKEYQDRYGEHARRFADEAADATADEAIVSLNQGVSFQRYVHALEVVEEWIRDGTSPIDAFNKIQDLSWRELYDLAGVDIDSPLPSS